MQVIKFVNIENSLTSHINKTHKIEIIEHDDVYIVTFRKYYSDVEGCRLTFSDSYTSLEKAQRKFDFYISLAMD